MPADYDQLEQNLQAKRRRMLDMNDLNQYQQLALYNQKLSEQNKVSDVQSPNQIDLLIS